MKKGLRPTILRGAVVALVAVACAFYGAAPAGVVRANDSGGCSLLAQQASLPGSDGLNVAVSGDTVATRGSGGNVLVFVRDGSSWPLQQTLVTPAAAPFNSGFAIDGDTIVVGAAGTAIGHVFVRNGSTWTLEQSLVVSDPGPMQSSSVAMDGDTLVIGSAAKAAYVFVHDGTNWSQQQKLTPAVLEGEFGSDMDVDGDVAVVGSAKRDPGDSGPEAYIFEREGASWTERQKLDFPNSGFDVSVGVDAGTVVASTIELGTRVYVRDGIGWVLQQILPGQNIERGSCVDICGDTVVIGQMATGTSGHPARVFVYGRDGTTWTERQQLMADNEANFGSGFGVSVAIDGCTVVAGRPFNFLQEPITAYVFTPAPVITCPPNVEVSAEGGECEAVVEFDVDATGVPAPTVTCTHASGSAFPVGTTTVTCMASNGAGPSASCSFFVTVSDDGAPSISDVSVSPSVIWPPDRRMVDVEVAYTSQDCSGQVSCSLSVTSNEPLDGPGDPSPDWEVVDAHHVRLRAERLRRGTGRVYTITILCTDPDGNSLSYDVPVFVPRSL